MKKILLWNIKLDCASSTFYEKQTSKRKVFGPFFQTSVITVQAMIKKVRVDIIAFKLYLYKQYFKGPEFHSLYNCTSKRIIRYQNFPTLIHHESLETPLYVFNSSFHGNHIVPFFIQVKIKRVLIEYKIMQLFLHATYKLKRWNI